MDQEQQQQDDAIRKYIDETATKAAVAAAAATVQANDARLKAIEERSAKHHHFLYGNGVEGLDTRVDRMEKTLTRVGSLGWRIIEVLTIAGVVGLIVLLAQNGLLKP